MSPASRPRASRTGDDVIDGPVIALTAGFEVATVKTLVFPAVLI
jgi:hypothetical protein